MQNSSQRHDLPIAGLSLDLDNQWSYMKTHGDAGWETFPTYLDVVVPRTLEIFKRHNFQITYFIVGQDAALKKNHASLRSIADAGHEVGNHSFRHEPWLHLYAKSEIEDEIEAAEDAIEEATGIRPTGFRGPGFSVSADVLQTLKARGYDYDASTFPTFLGPMARAYYFFNARLPKSEREKRKALFGGMKEGLRPLKPYEWQLQNGTLLEIPVTTMPGTRMPFHLSYILFLATYSRATARQYFKSALSICRATGVEPSLLLHPLDFLGGDDIEELKFFPAMNISGAEKIDICDELFDIYATQFDVVPMGKHANAIKKRGKLKSFEPRFDTVQNQLQVSAE